jgi:hypothetical protein
VQLALQETKVRKVTKVSRVIRVSRELWDQLQPKVFKDLHLKEPKVHKVPHQKE